MSLLKLSPKKITFLGFLLMVFNCCAQNKGTSTSDADFQSLALFAPEILSKKVEFSLTLTPSKNELFYVKRDSFYSMTSKSTIYTSKFESDKWSTPEIASFSGKYSDSSPFISPDGKRLFFTSDRPVDNNSPKKEKDIWYSELKGNNWNAPKHIPEVNSEFSEYSPSVDNHGNLYFGSYREGGKGSGDIWVSYLSNGKYTPPINLGQSINTSGGEWGSCIAPNGQYLIFEASGRTENLSNSGDLYISHYENNRWTKARHLGDLNSGGSDLTPKIHGQQLYFASNRHPDIRIEMNNNNVDLYQIDLEDLRQARFMSIDSNPEQKDSIASKEDKKSPPVFTPNSSSVSLTFVGEVLYRNSYEYIKIQCEKNICQMSIPYLDNNHKYNTIGNPTENGLWLVNRGNERWKFNTITTKENVKCELELASGKQKIEFRLQRESISEKDQIQYSGVYADNAQRKAIIYAGNNYIQIMSPYSEETMSLKPIGMNAFWSASGEFSTFSDLEDGVFQNLQIVDRFGIEKKLTRCTATKVEELWIPIETDTIYAKLYMPYSKSKIPACLVLPGGGDTGMDNYEYEARYLAAYGIASLIFDKPGNGKSKGSTDFRTQTFEEKNDMYKKVFGFLKSHPNVDSHNVGIHGPSEGGRLALMMAIDLKVEVAFVNAVAAPLMTFREGQFYAMDQFHRNMGIDEKDNMEIQSIWSDYYDGIEKGEIDSKIIERANSYRNSNERLFLPPGTTLIPASPPKDDISNDRVVTEANKITCPIFLQYGENDQRVSRPKSLQNFLPRVANPNQVQAKIYNRGSHSMMTPEYKICTGYMDDKMRWLKAIGIPLLGCNN